MRVNEKLKKLADAYREAADVIDIMTENEDSEKEDELAGMYIAKLLKIQNIQQEL